MSVDFNLVRDPWLPFLTAQGHRPLSLADAFRQADRVRLATGDALSDQAAHRFLLAVAYSALGSPTPDRYPEPLDGQAVVGWLEEHAGDFGLFDERRPFMQDPDLAVDVRPTKAGPVLIAQEIPVAYLDPSAALDRPLLTDHRTARDVAPMSSAQAALALLGLQAYATGGTARGANDAETGRVMIMAASPAATTVQLRPDGSLAQALSWARIPVQDAGCGNWTWTQRHTTRTGRTSDRDTPATSEADALTWLARRVLLHPEPDGTIARVQIHAGWRQRPTTPEPGHGPDSLAGTRDCLVSLKTPTVLQKTGELSESGYTTATGDPTTLALAWAAGDPDSLAGQVRTHLEGHEPTPRTSPPSSPSARPTRPPSPEHPTAPAPAPPPSSPSP